MIKEMITAQIYEQKQLRWASQSQRVFESLKECPQTRLMVSKRTDVPLQNVCRFVGSFRKQNAVCVVRKDIDPISKMPAEFLSTNENVCRPCQTGQINLFQ